MIDLHDSEFAHALVEVRDSIRRSPTALGLAVGLGSYWFRRTLLREPPLKAIAASAIMGLSVASAVNVTKGGPLIGEPIAADPS